MDLLFSFHQERNTTLLLVTHDAQIAKRCDRIITLKDGLVDVAGENVL